MRFADKQLKTNDTLALSFNSDALLVKTMYGFSVEAVITTADATGTFKLQTSNDNVTWVDYPSSSEALAGAAKNIMWNVSDVQFGYARVVYTRTGGGGAGSVCNIYALLKGSK